MFNKEIIAGLTNILHMIIEEYTIGFENTANRVLKLYISRIKSEDCTNGLVKFFNRQMLPDDCSLIALYTYTGSTFTFMGGLGLSESGANAADITTFHISIITDSKKCKNIKDNYCVISKDYKDCYIAIPIRMVKLSDTNQESINFFMGLLRFICQGYWCRDLVPYLFCKRVFNIEKGGLVHRLYENRIAYDGKGSAIESYIDTQLTELYAEPLSDIIKKELDKLQTGDDVLWNYLEEDLNNIDIEYTTKVPYYYWGEDGTTGTAGWIKY